MKWIRKDNKLQIKFILYLKVTYNALQFADVL